MNLQYKLQTETKMAFFPSPCHISKAEYSFTGFGTLYYQSKYLYQPFKKISVSTSFLVSVHL